LLSNTDDKPTYRYRLFFGSHLAWPVIAVKMIHARA
jgi:hypothetical protein